MPMDKDKLGSALAQAEKSQRRLNMDWDLASSWLRGDATDATSYDNVASARRARARSMVYRPNLLLDYYRVAMSRLGVEAPSLKVLPSTTSTEDIAKAIASQEALNHWWWAAKVDERWQKALGWLLVTGNVGFRVHYAKDEDEVLLDPFRPQDLLYEEGARDRDESDWVAMRKIVRREDLESQFPEKSEDIQSAASDDGDSTSWKTRILGKFATDPSKLKDRVTIYYIYYTQSRDYGIFMPNVGWLWQGELPEGVMGLHHLTYTAIPDTPWGIGLIAPLIAPMAQYNMSRKAQLKHLQLVNVPKVAIPYEAKVKNSAFTDRPGEVIRYKAGHPPQYMVGPSWPQGSVQSQETLRGELDDIAGMQAASLGKRPTGISSGVALRTLTAADMAKLDTTLRNIENVFGAIFRDALVLMKTHYSKARTVAMYDNYGHAIFRQLEGTQFLDSPDIQIDSGSMFPLRADEIEDRVVRRLNAGIYTAEEAAAKITLDDDRKRPLAQLQALTEAHQVLEAAKQGPIGVDEATGELLVVDIQIFKTDPLKAYVEVFQEFVRDQESFYALPPERQDIIMDILMAVSNPDNPSAQSYEEGIVYPPLVDEIGDIGDVAARAQSPMTAAMTANHIGDLQEQKQLGSQVDSQVRAAGGQLSTRPAQVNLINREQVESVPGQGENR